MAATTAPNPVNLPKPQEWDAMDLASQRASILIREQLASIETGVKAIPTPTAGDARNEIAQVAPTLQTDDTLANKTYKIGIIGAGAAGLFTGLMFDYLKETLGLKVDWEILEVHKADRLGGRLFTHHFSEQPHDYYDVGAMRFPENPVMDRVFELFEGVLGMKKNDSLKNAKVGDLVPYYLQGKNTIELFNDVQQHNPVKSASTGKTFKITGLGEYVDKKPGDIVGENIQYYVDEFKKDPKTGWEKLKEVDGLSVRQFLLNKFKHPENEHINFDVTEWLETFTLGVAWFDEAFSELVMDELNFAFEGNWRCVLGGAQEIAKRMFTNLEDYEKKHLIQGSRTHFSKKVTKITREPALEAGPTKQIVVTVEVEEQPRKYDAVFNSAPLGSMQRMDLRGLNLNWGTKQAIRSLGYGASCKVGVRFKKTWWISRGINQGGVSKTDLPIHMCVYPSYNLDDSSGVLLVSYTWSLEAQRIGTLISRNSPQDEDELKDLLIDNLTRLHVKDESEYNDLHKTISEAYDTHFAYDWFSDKGTTGAFAYFGPGQFKNVYPYIVRNDGKHIIIGEAASSHHAWVVGALESAVRGVYQFLYHHSKHDPAVDKVLEAYNEGKVKGPYGPLPAEFNRLEGTRPLDPDEDVPEIKDGISAQGELLRFSTGVESLRLQQGGDMLDLKAVTEEDVKDVLNLAFSKFGDAS